MELPPLSENWNPKFNGLFKNKNPIFFEIPK
jgi:hypothetical protein